MKLNAGKRLRSTACTTEVVVVKAADGEIELMCGGAPLEEIEGPSSAAGVPQAGYDGGTLLGKRYVHASSGLEILCTKGGNGSLSVGADLLDSQQAKPLPSSD
jgi:hypothetical protein